MSKALRLSILAAAIAMSLTLGTSAQAAPITVGSPLTGSFMATASIPGHPSALADTSLAAAGAHVFSPINGTVVRWRLAGSFSSGPFRLQVLRPSGGGEYKDVAESAPQTRSGSSIQTFSSALPIQTGDLIALADSHESDQFGATLVSGSAASIWNPELTEGLGAAPSAVESNLEIGFNADVQPLPTITAFGPTSGPASGGTSVTIGGTDFEGVSAVKFGSVAVSSFVVNSEGQITAVAPPAAAGAVNVSVTTLAGTASSAQQFTYAAAPAPSVPATCHVPKLIGKKLKAAKQSLVKAGCKLGKVKGHKSKSAKVKRQSPKPGKVLAAGTKVNVKLGK